MTGPLTGVRVLDWTVWQQGPAAGAMLGDLGAEVLKLEQREVGDPGRSLQTMAGLDLQGIDNAFFEAVNRSKKSLAIDMKHPQGLELVHRLVAESDVFLHNFRPGVPERLGLDYETLREINPRLVYASASAFGEKGPDRTGRAYDVLALARSGIMHASRVSGTDIPGHPKGAIADQIGAISLAFGVLAGIVARERLGVGQRIDASLLGGMVWLQNISVAMQLMAGGTDPSGSRRSPTNPLWNYYRCGDEKWLAFAMPQSDRYWGRIVEILGQPELAHDPRFADMASRRANTVECVAILDELFASQPRAYWLDQLAVWPDIPVAPINSIAEVVDDPQLAANDYIVEFDHPVRGPTRVVGFPISMSETPMSIQHRAPEFGEHTEEILMDLLGLDWDDIVRLRDENVI